MSVWEIDHNEKTNFEGDWTTLVGQNQTNSSSSSLSLRGEDVVEDKVTVHLLLLVNFSKTDLGLLGISVTRLAWLLDILFFASFKWTSCGGLQSLDYFY